MFLSFIMTTASSRVRPSSLPQSSLTWATTASPFPSSFLWSLPFLHFGHWFFQCPIFSQNAHWSFPSRAAFCLGGPCLHLPFSSSSLTPAADFLALSLHPSFQLLKTLSASSSKVSKSCTVRPCIFWSLCLMSPVDCPTNKSTSCCIPSSDSGFKGVWSMAFASHKCFKNSECVSEGPCLTA